MENNCPNHKDTRERIERTEDDLRLVVAEIATIKQELVRIADSSKAAHKRLDESSEKIVSLEQRNEEVLRLAMSIERLAESIRSHNDAIVEHDNRLRIMEGSAGKYALKMWQIVAGLVLTGAVGFLLAHFGIGG